MELNDAINHIACADSGEMTAGALNLGFLGISQQ